MWRHAGWNFRDDLVRFRVENRNRVFSPARVKYSALPFVAEFQVTRRLVERNRAHNLSLSKIDHGQRELTGPVCCEVT